MDKVQVPNKFKENWGDTYGKFLKHQYVLGRMTTYMPNLFHMIGLDSEERFLDEFRGNPIAYTKDIPCEDGTLRVSTEILGTHRFKTNVKYTLQFIPEAEGKMGFVLSDKFEFHKNGWRGRLLAHGELFIKSSKGIDLSLPNFVKKLDKNAGDTELSETAWYVLEAVFSRLKSLVPVARLEFEKFERECQERVSMTREQIHAMF